MRAVLAHTTLFDEVAAVRRELYLFGMLARYLHAVCILNR